MRPSLAHPAVRLHLRQGSSFILCGLLNAFLDFLILLFCIELLHISVSTTYIASNIITLVVGFYFNRRVTFRAHAGNQFRQMIRFGVVYGIASVLNYAAAIGLYELGIFLVSAMADAALTPVLLRLLPYAAKALAIGITAVWNYTLSHTFIFRTYPLSVSVDTDT